jgi:antitoxin component YwqK of YwqJK toxin-antitoxin module
LEKDLPILSEGEPAFTVDSWKFFVGSKNGNKQVFGNGSVIPNNQSWVSFNAQDTFTITNGSIPNVKSIFVFVGGIIQPNITILGNTSFKLPEPLDANVDVFAIWFESSSNNGTSSSSDTSTMNLLTGSNNFTTNYTYTVSGDIATETVQDSKGNIVSSCAYNYLNSKISTVVFVMNGITTTSTYNYDSNGNLTSVVNTQNVTLTDNSTLNLLTGSNNFTTNYTYTSSGDIATEIVKDGNGYIISSTTYNYINNQLSTIVLVMNRITTTSTYNYDSNGNLINIVNTQS